MTKDEFVEKRKAVVERLEAMGYVKTEAIKRAMLKVKREDFVAAEHRDSAYVDTPLPIPGGVTISAPHMHAIFMSTLKLQPGDKVLEVGAGSGILLAYMKEVVGPSGKVYGIEIIPETYEFAKRNLRRAGYARKVKLVLGDGSKGLPAYAPYDKIVCSASSPNIPKPWLKQLKPGGIIVTPVGEPYGHQELVYVEKTKKGKIIRKNLGGVIFVPLIGEHGFK